MKKDKELSIFGGQTIWKSHSEHYTERQFIYGSPLNYVKEYMDWEDEKREKYYILWQFNIETLSYEVLDREDGPNYRRLIDAGNKLEDDRREAHHVNYIRTMPRSFWSDRDIEKYGHLPRLDDDDDE